MNEVEAEGLSTFAQAEEGALSVALVIDRGGLIAVWRAVAEHAEDNDGELTGGGSDGLGFADASSEAAVRSLSTPVRHSWELIREQSPVWRGRGLED